MLSAVFGGSGGIGKGAAGFSSAKRGEKLFTYASKSTRSWRMSGRQDGIPLAWTPRLIVSNKSVSSGRLPEGVDRHL
jgi:hypothetical protein